MASRAELANGFLCPRSELCDQEPEHMHLSAITASHGCAAGEENGWISDGCSLASFI